MYCHLYIYSNVKVIYFDSFSNQAQLNYEKTLIYILMDVE
jgi:hypothetical protein